MFFWMIMSFLFFSCEEEKVDTGDAGPDPFDVDDDGDGLTENDGDCDDADPFTFPGAAEHEAVFACMTDADEDGWGSMTPLVGVAAGTDCDDADIAYNNDDQDGDGKTSCQLDCDDTDSAMNLFDVDGDGYHTCSGDCDDSDPNTFPGSAEKDSLDACMTDTDQDGWGDDSPLHSGDAGTDCNDYDPRDNQDDVDQDGVTSCDGDCDDNSMAIHNLDNDGDGESPCDGDCNDTDPNLNRIDFDLDGYTSCYGDCNDQDPNTYPGAVELCDGQFNDCSAVDYQPFNAPHSERDDDLDGSVECVDDGSVWSGVDPISGYGDCDDSNSALNQNDVDADGATTCDGDCDDANASTFPGSAELESATACMTDADGDGYGEILDCCYTLIMQDAWGDGWNGAYITITIDGIDVATHTVSEQAGANEVVDICLEDGSQLLISYSPGDHENDNSYMLQNPDGGLAFSDGPAPITGPAYTETLLWSSWADCAFNIGVVSGTDCDDGNSIINIGSVEVYGDSLDNNCNGITDGQNTVINSDAEFLGMNTGDRIGNWLASAGDIDGDGFSDLLVGAPHDDAGGLEAGGAYLLMGSTITSGVEDINVATVQFTGENSGDTAGMAIASAGDIDGDEMDEIIIGAKNNDDGGNAAGKAYLFLGANINSGVYSLATADMSFTGEYPVDMLGSMVGSAGDVDDDGFDDLLIGAQNNDDGGNKAGKIYLFLGSGLTGTGGVDMSDADTVFLGENPNDKLSTAVSIGDADGDGMDDLLFSSPVNGDGGQNAGKAYFVPSGDILAGSIDLDYVSVSFVGEYIDDNAGKALTGLGDVDNDGFDDFALSAPGSDINGDESGTIYVITNVAMLNSSLSLSDVPLQIYGEAEGDNAGHALSMMSDIDGDGKTELVIGAPYNDSGFNNGGKTYLIYGASILAGTIDLIDADISFTGADENNLSGSALAAPGDLNNDGVMDLVIGSPANNANGPQTGKIHLFFNPMD